QRDDDARRASHVAESVLVLVLDYLADEFATLGAQPRHGFVHACDCEHDAPKAQRVRRCDRWLDLDELRIVELRQLQPPVPIWSPHHDYVDSDPVDAVDAVHPPALDRRPAFYRHAERGEEGDRGV